MIYFQYLKYTAIECSRKKFCIDRSHMFKSSCILLKSLWIYVLIVQSATYFVSAEVTDSLPRVHAIAEYGEPLYPANFTAPHYVNPDAPKGGTIRLAALGRGFDNFNPFIDRGLSPEGITSLFESLTTNLADDPFGVYGQVAEYMSISHDKTQITFYINPKARFHNGQPITADDVVFSYHILMDKGAAVYKINYKGVTKVEALDSHTVRYHLEGDPKLIYRIGLLPILSRQDFSGRDFDRPSLEHIPLGSGPYKVGAFEPGRFIEYVRVEDYWGEDLPVNRGQNNFDRLRYEFYFDATTALEAFKAGKLDLRHDASPRIRATGYNIPAKEKGWFRLEGFPHQRIANMQGFVFNLQRSYFQDINVRRALSLAMDIPWAIEYYAFGAYVPSHSFFGNSPLEAQGLPTIAEKQLLVPLQAHFPASVLTDPAVMAPTPQSQAEFNVQLRTADRLLTEAGYPLRQGQRLTPDNIPWELDIVTSQGFERLVLQWCTQLERLGIGCRIQIMDGAQLETRLKKRQFDITLALWPVRLTPGSELYSFWGSEAADQDNTLNVMGLKNPAVDALIKASLEAADRESQITAIHALDRVLRSLYFVVPNFHAPQDWVASWHKFGRPTWVPTQRVAITAALNEWWFDADKAKALEDAMRHNRSLIESEK